MTDLGRCLAVLGTGSDVGKSVAVTALCRIFSDLGLRVAPFKAQNMSNNSYVTPLGGEMGRAQVAQAEAARVALHTDMNPVLLKPSSDTGAQVVLHGRPVGNRQAADYFADTGWLFREALASLERLRARYELVVLEGAGSCAEVNLWERDIVNLSMARAADAPIILAADIDRGGVFAQLIGTVELLPPADRERVRGLLINRFRGDPALFRDGIAFIERRTGIPVLGLIPWFRHIEIDSEDGLPLEVRLDPPAPAGGGRIGVAVLRLPHISNFTDFAPLARDPRVCLQYLSRPRDLGPYTLLVLPGTKNVRADLSWVRGSGWEGRLAGHAARGGRIAGICGGYQMLGRVVHDPDGVEGPPGDTPGLGFLEVETTLYTEKVLTCSAGRWLADGSPVDGYEIHMGRTVRRPGVAPLIGVTARGGREAGEPDGAADGSGRIWGTYFHGLFDNPGFRRRFLASLDPSYPAAADSGPEESGLAFRDRQYGLLADHFRAHLDLDRLFAIAGIAESDRNRGR